MPKNTPSMAKNKIKRSLNAVFDPYPTKKEENELWDYFNHSCAYCGVEIERESRKGHLDHLTPASKGGGNNIHNFALSCPTCNGDEKREELWLSFLSKKCESNRTHKERKNKIEKWLGKAPRVMHTEEQLIKVDVIIIEAISQFEKSVEKIRLLKRHTPNKIN